jgi:N6-L-threonylcarbamoyladenine synthase
MHKEKVYILAIESSCDETSAAVLCNEKVLSNYIANQDIHFKYGGVVPELASREHQKNIVPVVDQALKKAGVSKEMIQAVAFTKGPGLLGSLLVGSSFAKAFALGLHIPLIEVNHMQAHIFAHFIQNAQINTNHKPTFPFLCLTISGGHTQIIKVSDYYTTELIGQTLDDAAGEAFDKSAKLLGLPYPGGPLIDKHAKEGDPYRFPFPHPNVAGLDFSFSGLKSSILYFLRDRTKEDADFISKNVNDLCASVQHTISEILLNKIEKASLQTGITEIAIAGGVSANSYLRQKLQDRADKNNWNIYVPKLEYCTDNAAMIGIVGYFKYLKKDFSDQHTTARARWEL